MLNWQCIYAVRGWKISDTFIAELIESDPRAALQRLKNDDRVWDRGARLVVAKPVMQPRSPWGGIKFEYFGRAEY